MPSHLDFDTTKSFRNFILGKTLTVPNGPQSWTAESYTVQKVSDMSNTNPGVVDDMRTSELIKSQTKNVFKPTEYSVIEDLETAPRKANLSLYPYFETGQRHNMVSIMTNDDYSQESELMKFAAWNIQSNPQGPFFGRMQQNLYTTTAGKVRVLDALQGNTTTAINLVTGREPLVEMNTKITVAKTLAGKGIDFLQTVTGVEFPWSEIPGDYLSNPKNPIVNKPTANSEGGKFLQDITGALGSLVGIQRRPRVTRKPSDLLLEYSGERQKQLLFDNLTYSKYGPDYTTTARSQNSSKIFNFVDKIGSGVKNLLGLEAPKKVSYIGDDRGNNVKDAMTDFNDNIVKSSYYLSLMFDPIQATVFERKKTISEGGSISGQLTWISTKSKNKLGVNNEEYSSEQSLLAESLSTGFKFREDSILGKTQEILETLPSDGGASRSHVANVIDQTSRVFREGESMMSRGSAVKYIDKFTGTESGVEYCRVWTKDRSYMNNSDTMKTTGLSRKFGSSVYSNAWNLNIYPNSNGNGAFDSGSTNLAKGMGDGFYAKKYMFSIENLAWKTSNTPGFTYNDLPYCERGPNGGRVMWFPPYDLKVNEQNSARWEENVFLGRPEPVYTYQNTTRGGSISFKVIVDHPSILNLLVRDHFKNMSDEEADNYINAFFAGCEDVDFYGMIRKYTTLTEDDVTKIRSYLNGNKDPNTIKRYKTVITPAPDIVTPKNEIQTNKFETTLYFQNDYPDPASRTMYSTTDFGKLEDDYIKYKSTYLGLLNTGLNKLTEGTTWSVSQKTDYKALTGIPVEKQKTRPSDDELNAMKTKAVAEIESGFAKLSSSYNEFTNKLSEIKKGLEEGTVKNIKLRVGSRTSSIADDNYNLYLSYRRSHSFIKDIFNKIAATPEKASGAIDSFKWKKTPKPDEKEKTETGISMKLTDLGFDKTDGDFIIEYVSNIGEQPIGTSGNGMDNADCTENNKIVTSSELKQTAPITFWCRQSTLKMIYETKEKDEPTPAPLQPTSTLVEITDTPTGNQTTPPIDEMKRIIMKTLAECYYFKKLEEDSPVQFSSLKEKLRYFHPSFHSMTPEGLNARLTFLQQCIRPGDTLPIKGISDVSDMNARNTTFGPPPICVMRIGDFYHSKVAIKDINIEYEDNLWDINPEGIGVQPMIATVTLQVNFIGGHGLGKPVERLQNALSSNFYANTEMYDPRSISTETTIAGEDSEKFTKKFLEELVKDNSPKANPTSQEPTAIDNKVTEGVFIGTNGSTGTLVYTNLVKSTFTATESYYKTYINAYNSIVPKYDTRLACLLLSPIYRTIKDYTVQTGTGTDTIELLGSYPKNSELNIQLGYFEEKMLARITNDNMTTLLGFNKDMSPSVQVVSERILKPYILKTVSNIIGNLSRISEVKDVENARNTLIKTLDGLNFILETGYDGKVGKDNYYGVQLTGFTSDMLYPLYSDTIKFLKDEHHRFTDDLDNTYVFNPNTTLSSDDLSYFLSVLLKDYTGKIVDLYRNNTAVFSERVVKDIEKRIGRFVLSNAAEKTFKVRYPLLKNDKAVSFAISSESEPFTDVQKGQLKSIHTTSPNKTTSVLNYYR